MIETPGLSGHIASATPIFDRVQAAVEVMFDDLTPTQEFPAPTAETGESQ